MIGGKMYDKIGVCKFNVVILIITATKFLILKYIQLRYHFWDSNALIKTFTYDLLNAVESQK